jgi:hypothetical protein
VIDFQAPSSKRALEALGDGPSKALLLKFAVWCTGSEVDAEDLFAETRDCLCDPEDGRPWDPARGSFLTHARMVMRDLGRRGRRSARARREVLDGRLATDETTADPRDPPDEALHGARELDRDRRLGGLLRQRLRGTALHVFDRRCEGHDDGAEMARLCRCTIEQIYEANRTIAYQASRILAEERKTEAHKMKNLQTRAKKKWRWVPWRLPEERT